MPKLGFNFRDSLRGNTVKLLGPPATLSKPIQKINDDCQSPFMRQSRVEVQPPAGKGSGNYTPRLLAVNIDASRFYDIQSQSLADVALKKNMAISTLKYDPTGTNLWLMANTGTLSNFW